MGEQLGPFTAAEIRNGLRDGSMDPFDLVGREGSNLRVEMVEVDEIFVSEPASLGKTGEGSDVATTTQIPKKEIAVAAAEEDTRLSQSQASSVVLSDLTPAVSAVAEIQINQRPLADALRNHHGVRQQSVAEKKIGARARKAAAPSPVRDPMRYHLIDRKGRSIGPISAREIVALFLKGVVDRSCFVIKNNINSRVPVEKFVMVYARQENGRRKQSFEIAEPSRFNSMDPRKASRFKRALDTGQILAKAYLERERLTRLAYGIAFLLIIAAVCLALYSIRQDLEEKISPFTKSLRSKIERKLDSRERNKHANSALRNARSHVGNTGRYKLQSGSLRGVDRTKSGQQPSTLQSRNSPRLHQVRGLRGDSAIKGEQHSASRKREMAQLSQQERQSRSRDDLRNQRDFDEAQRQIKQKVERMRLQQEQTERLRQSIMRRQQAEESAKLARSQQRVVMPRPRFAAGAVSQKGAVAASMVRPSAPVRPKAAVAPVQSSSGPRVDALVDGQQIAGLGPMRFDPSQVETCETACSVTFTGAGGSFQVKFFKAVWGEVLLNKTSGVHVSGLVRKGESGTTLLLSNVQ